MLGITDLPAYLVGLALIILLPGPNSLYVVSVAARRGVRPGYQAAGGVFCGDAVLMALSAGGVASLLQASPIAFSVVKFVGAGYLTWLAIGLLRAAWGLWRRRHESTSGPTTAASCTAGEDSPTSDRSPGERPFRWALLASLLNPKAILFFVSFFVQFVDAAYPYPALTFLALGAWAQLFSLAYLSLLIFSGTRLAAAFHKRRRLQAGASAAAGTAFLGFAAKLSVSSG